MCERAEEIQNDKLLRGEMHYLSRNCTKESRLSILLDIEANRYRTYQLTYIMKASEDQDPIS